MARILVTGASGFIGKQLIEALLKEGHTVIALVRVRGTVLFSKAPPNLQICYGDILKPESLDPIEPEVDAAYYLMHSMKAFTANLKEQEAEAANNFLDLASRLKVKQIIYLSGIVGDERLSPHLESRLFVENTLRKGPIPATVLRASIIIGKGSASFEIIRDLVEKLPVMVAPKWINNLCQPIAIADVIFYLTHVLLQDKFYDRVFDIGGPEPLTFKEALHQYAKVRNLKRHIFVVPVLTPRLSSYWLLLVTSVSFPIAYYLVESMKTNSACRDDSIRSILPHTCMNYREALSKVFEDASKSETTSTWMDAWDPGCSTPSLARFMEIPKSNVLEEEVVKPLECTAEEAVENIWSIGGDRGWGVMQWAWNIRGFVDKLVGGVGLRRGRVHPRNLKSGDYIDFWRVVKADRENRELILYAEMKLPGEAWLKFRVEDINGKPSIRQTAIFSPRGILGRIYWFVLIPFHKLIFPGMASSLAKKEKPPLK